MTRFGYIGPRPHTEQVVEDLFRYRWPRLAVDIETVSLKDRTMIGFGVAPSPHEAWYFPMIGDADYDLIFRVFELLGSSKVTKVFHNAAYDLHELDQYGVDDNNIVDTSTMAWHLGLPAVLGQLASGICNLTIESAKEFMDRLRIKTMDKAPLDELALKCSNDCMATMAVYERMEPYTNWYHFGRDMRLLPLLLRMGRKGVRIDQEARLKHETRLLQEAEHYRQLAEAEGFNPGSPDQVGYILQSRGNWLPWKKLVWPDTKLKVETGEEYLEKLTDPMAAVVLGYRGATKLLGTYLKPWRPPATRGYTRYHLNVVTGRTASADRNMQNIPVELRDCILPDEGYNTFTEIDFAQQEYRALAHISGDPELQRIFREGLDLHQETADFMGIARKTAKNVNYAMTYGGDDQTIAATAHIDDPRLGAELRNSWQGKFPTATRWIAEQGERGLEEGKVYTLQGRTLYLPERGTVPDDDIRRKAVNYPIQGSAAEVMKDALLHTECLDPRITVHDSGVYPGRIDRAIFEGLGIGKLRDFDTAFEVTYKINWRDEGAS